MLVIKKALVGLLPWEKPPLLYRLLVLSLFFFRHIDHLLSSWDLEVLYVSLKCLRTPLIVNLLELREHLPRLSEFSQDLVGLASESSGSLYFSKKTVERPVNPPLGINSPPLREENQVQSLHDLDLESANPEDPQAMKTWFEPHHHRDDKNGKEHNDHRSYFHGFFLTFNGLVILFYFSIFFVPSQLQKTLSYESVFCKL